MTLPVLEEPKPQPEPRFDPRATHTIHDWAHTARLFCCRVDPTGRYVCAGSTDHTVQRWEIATGTKTPLVGHTNWVSALGFSPDGTALYSGSYDGRLITWETAAAAPQPVRTITAHDGWLRAIAVSSDGQWIATAGNDHLVKIWSAATGEKVRELAGHTQHVFCVQFVPGSRELVSGDCLGNIHHWNGEDGKLVRQFDARDTANLIGDIAPFGGILTLAFNRDGSRLTAGGHFKVSNAPAGNRRAVATTWDWKTGERVLRQESVKEERDATLWRAVHHPRGPLLGIVAKELGFWEPESVELFHLLKTPSEMFDFDLHPNGLDLFTAHFDGHLRGHRCAPA